MAGYVYFLSSGTQPTPIKIGQTTNLDQRPKALQTGNPEKLTLICSIHTYKHAELEKKLHTLWHAFRRQGGEWFDITAETANTMVGIWDNLMDVDNESEDQKINRFLGMIRFECAAQLSKKK